MSTQKFLRLPEVLERTGLARSTVYALIAQHKFPAPCPLSGGRAVGFLASEVDAYLAACVSARDSATASRAAA
jgi:prophage regulatory protein